jgi:hypothetical protein
VRVLDCRSEIVGMMNWERKENSGSCSSCDLAYDSLKRSCASLLF